MSVVKNNLMTISGYTPYCGNDQFLGSRLFGARCSLPRTQFKIELGQFKCPECGWKTQLDKKFINEYKERWSLKQGKYDKAIAQDFKSPPPDHYEIL